MQLIGFTKLGYGGVLLGLELLCLGVAAWAVTRGAAPGLAIAAWGSALALWGVFGKLWVHPRSIVMTSDGDPGFTPTSIDAAFASRAKVLRLAGPPYAYFILDAMKRVTAEDLTGVEPIRDSLLVHEYRYRSLPEFFGRWPLDVGPRRWS